MNTDGHRWGRWRMGAVAFAALGLVLSGCSLPQAQPDPTRFYVLSSPAAGPVAGVKGPAVHLRPVELASYIKSKPMIVRRGDNEIEFREYARWGEPLEQGIGRVLREELLARGAAGAVLASGLRAVGVDYDYELTVRVLACEGAPVARSFSGRRGSCRRRVRRRRWSPKATIDRRICAGTGRVRRRWRRS